MIKPDKDITCLDCGKEFKWYVDTLRCSECKKIHRNKYVKKDNYRKEEMVILNRDGEIVGEATRPVELTRVINELRTLAKNQVPVTGCTDIFSKLDSKKFKSLKGVGCSYHGGYYVMYKEEATQENIQKVLEARRGNFGKKYRTNVTEPHREIILKISKDGRLDKEIAEEYGMSRSAVNHIKTGRSYSQITGIEYKRRYRP